MKRHSYTKFFLLTASATLSSQAAFAGMADMINEFFTFREEQKELIRPNYTLPPKHVVVPYYDDQSATKWSNYYTREDLAPTQNMDGSSMVMRPSQKMAQQRMEEQRLREQQAMQQQQTRPFTGHNDMVANAKPQPLGFEAIQRRDHLNRVQNLEGNVYIGEPGSGPQHDYNAGSNVGKKVHIGEPKRAWNEDVPNNYASPRPGDYDYRSGQYNTEPRETITYANEPQYPQATGQQPRTFAGQGNTQTRVDLPTQYTVQQNDTLSGISDKDQIYGDWKLWPIIYDANKTQISDPDLIHPQQNLGIPRDSNTYEQQDARRRAAEKQSPYDFYDGK